MSIGLIELIGVIELLSITSIKVRGLLMKDHFESHDSGTLSEAAWKL